MGFLAAGMAAGLNQGLGQGLGNMVQKQLELRTAGHKAMADMYGKLAESYADNPQIMGEFLKRSNAHTAAYSNPFDQNLSRAAKEQDSDPTAPITAFHNSQIMDMHKQAGITPDKNSFLQGGKSLTTNPLTSPPQSQAAAPTVATATPAPASSTLGGQAPPTTAAAPVQAPAASPAPPSQNMRELLLSRMGMTEDDVQPYVFNAAGHVVPNPKAAIFNKALEGIGSNSTYLTGDQAASWGMPPNPQWVDQRNLNPMARVMSGKYTADSRMMATGKFTRDLVTGQLRPARVEEMPVLDQEKMVHMQNQDALSQATIAYRNAQEDYARRKGPIEEQKLGMALQHLALAKAHYDLSYRNYYAQNYGTDPNSNFAPLPGAAATPDGQGGFSPVGQRFASNVKPTSASQTKADAGANVIKHGDKLVEFMSNPANDDLFGKVSGRWEEFVAGKIGTNEPRETELRADLRSLASLLAPLHGFRSANAAKEFLETLHQTNSPEAAAAAVRAYVGMAQVINEQGTPIIFNGKGGVQQRGPSSPTSTGAKGIMGDPSLPGSVIAKSGPDKGKPLYKHSDGHYYIQPEGH